MSGLLGYLNVLDSNADALIAHRNDPQTAMKQYGLSEVEQAAMLSGNKITVLEVIGIPNEQFHAIDTLEITY